MSRTIVLVLLLALAGVVLVFAFNSPSHPAGTSPVLVELFTSEGCSSCPPADRLLQELDRTQPVAGAKIIVLSEHVDYWNQLGWKDPYSSHSFSERQSAYSSRFRLNSVYTPQMVVDGSTEFVGDDSKRADRACEQANRQPKIPVRIVSVSTSGGNALHARIETDTLADSISRKQADVYLALALDHAQSQVARGENSGRLLTHVAVVETLTKVGKLEKGKSFARDVDLKLPPGTDPANLRLVAFVQEPGPGRVLGAASERVQK